MKPGKGGYRVAVVGASSLLGKELVSILEDSAERAPGKASLPVSRLLTFEAEEGEPELPILDLSRIAADATEGNEVQVSKEDLDFAFICARLPQLPGFLIDWQQQGDAARCTVIDVIGEGLAAPEHGVPPDAATASEDRVRIPFLDHRFPIAGVHHEAKRFHVCAHPAVVALSSLLLRLAARFKLTAAVAQVFVPASESGSRGVEELQRQTVNILSFQKVPDQIFGAQLAFNLLPRLGSSAKGGMTGLESRLRHQLHNYLDGRVPVPSLRLITAPVFYSVSVSLFVETAEPVTAEAAAAALSGERILVRKPTLGAPTPVEVTGSSDILVDSPSVDVEHPNGLWLWAVADNLHLAATNAAELAASLREPARA